MNTSFSTDSSSERWSRKLFASRLAWLVVVGLLCVAVFGVRWFINRDNAVFLRTTSPLNTYTLNLKGNKGRPFIIPNHVKADVIKLNQPFISDIFLHSALDSFDLSFEAGFPDIRWLGDTAIEFYRAGYFEKGVNSLIVSNRTDKTIKYLQVETVSKFLLFELQPGNSVTLKIPAPRGDQQWISVQGSFADGTAIPVNTKSFDQSPSDQKTAVYNISISDLGTTIASEH